MSELPEYVKVARASSLIKEAGVQISKKMAGESERYFELLEKNDPEKYVGLVFPAFFGAWHKKMDLDLLKKNLREWVADWERVVVMCEDVRVAA